MRLNTRVILALGILLHPGFSAMANDICELRAGCGEASLCAAPEDTSAKGSFAVGARTIQVKKLNVEVWYPAQTPTSLTAVPKNYDLRQWLPSGEQKKIPDDKVPPQPCDCFADLPVDKVNGPYPVILFAHGTAAFRTQSLSLMTHLASRGFVVLAADHPGLYLGDLLQFKFNAQVTTDLQSILSSLRDESPETAFLKDSVQLKHIGLIGHSAGGNAVSGGAAWEGVEFLVPMAAGGTKDGTGLRGSLILGGLDDKVVAYNRQQTGFQQSPAPKRLVGISNAGHLAFSDLCAMKNKDGEDLVQVAQRFKISNAGFATRLWDGCAKGQLDPLKARQIVNSSVAAGAEEALQCLDRSETFKNFKSRFADVAEFQEIL